MQFYLQFTRFMDFWNDIHKSNASTVGNSYTLVISCIYTGYACIYVCHTVSQTKVVGPDW